MTPSRDCLRKLKTMHSRVIKFDSLNLSHTFLRGCKTVRKKTRSGQQKEPINYKTGASIPFDLRNIRFSAFYDPSRVTFYEGFTTPARIPFLGPFNHEIGTFQKCHRAGCNGTGERTSRKAEKYFVPNKLACHLLCAIIE